MCLTGYYSSASAQQISYGGVHRREGCTKAERSEVCHSSIMDRGQAESRIKVVKLWSRLKMPVTVDEEAGAVDL